MFNGSVDVDVEHLRWTIGLAAQAREHGNHPFGSLLVDAGGNVLLEAENTVVTDRDCTGHAELNLVRAASKSLEPADLRDCTLYASTEPCAMCAGAIFWSGIGRVVFALSSAALMTMLGEEAAAGRLDVSSRDVLERGGHPVEVVGPLIEDEAREVHAGFWG